MIKHIVFISLSLATCVVYGAEGVKWPEPVAPAIPQADGYVIIPGAAVPPSDKSVYKTIFDSTQSARNPDHLIPALNMAGSELNALVAAGLPVTNARFVVVFHGPSVNGILQNDAYRAKFGVDNPNLPVLRKLKELGVELFVCGQFLAAEGTDPETLSPDVAVASDALIVLMTYQNQGYALLNF